MNSKLDNDEEDFAPKFQFKYSERINRNAI